MGTDAQVTVRVSILKDIAEALGAAADALAKLGDSIAHLIGLGVRGYDVAHARADLDRLHGLLAHLITYYGRNTGIIFYIDDFIEYYIKNFMPNGLLVRKPPSDYIVYSHPIIHGEMSAGFWRPSPGRPVLGGVMKTAEAWEIIKERLNDLLADASIILEALQKKSGGFVLDKTYMDLVSILTERANVLTKLAEFPPPNSDEEIEALRAVTEKYRNLKDRLG